jgi:hypothetical protein
MGDYDSSSLGLCDDIISHGWTVRLLFSLPFLLLAFACFFWASVNTFTAVCCFLLPAFLLPCCGHVVL